MPPDPTEPALNRLRSWVAVAVAVSAVVYVGYGAVSGWKETKGALITLDWRWMAPVLLTTLLNYALRWAKWRLMLRRLTIHIPIRLDLHIYAIGLMMTLSPGKAGEVVKPWLVRRATGTPVLQTVPVLVVERLTDAIAVLSLAALGAASYASDQLGLLLAALGLIAGGTLALASARVSDAGVWLLDRLPVVRRAVPAVRGALAALRTCLSPTSLVLCIVLSLVAWWAECLGTWMVLKAFGLSVSIGTATFLYAFATALGAISPGGVGVTDATLISGAQKFVAGITLGTATATALVIRIATLWFGVLLGALALLRIEQELRTHSFPEEQPPL